MPQAPFPSPDAQRSVGFQFIFAMGLMMLALTTGAQTTKDQPFRSVDGAFFAVSVADLDASAQWYTEKLGLTVVSRFSDGKASGALLAGGGLEVEMIAHADARTQDDALDPGRKVLTRGIFKAGFTVDDFNRAVDVLRGRGVDFVAGPFPSRREQRANAVIRDNSGNLIQIFGRFAPPRP